MKQLHVFFSGQVQGVGFRQTTKRLAKGFSVAGWVKNLDDGRVEMLAEGEETELQRFFDLLQTRMKNNIREKEVVWGLGAGIFREFEITYL